MNLLAAARYVLRIRTNLVLIIASACGYYFMAGVEIFGTEFTREQYHINQSVANFGLVVLGAGAVAGGTAGDALLGRRHLSGQILVAALAASGTVVLFIPAIFTRDLIAALPYLIGAAFCLSAQNPLIDAARLDIMPPPPWGRSESIRTVLRSFAQSLAPLLFGAVADHVFGGGTGRPAMDVRADARPAGRQRRTPLLCAAHLSSRRRDGWLHAPAVN